VQGKKIYFTDMELEDADCTEIEFGQMAIKW
jgi:hypothetical protein